MTFVAVQKHGKARPALHQLAGIVSWGSEDCFQKTPAVFSRVTSHIDWILRNSDDPQFASDGYLPEKVKEKRNDDFSTEIEN